ncbi:MAG: ATP-binding cassette domain-containing protein [Dehalococcoidia bacterium]
MFIIETKDLTKNYGTITAVDQLNLHIEEGDIFGFLGPNGAGKSNTILMLLGLTEPTSGTSYVAGFNSTREPLKVKRIAGYVPEKVGFYEDLTAAYNLSYTAKLNGLSDEQTKAKERKMTIVMSSHQLYQVQRICNRVGMLMNGKLVLEGLLDELSREAMGGSQFRIEVKLTEITQDIIVYQPD